MSTSSIQFRKTRGVADVLNVTFRFVRAEWRLLIRSLFYFAAPLLIVGVGFFSVGSLDTLFALLQDPAGGFQSPGLFFAGVALLILCTSVGTALGVTGVLAVVRLYEERGPNAFGLEEVWTLTRDRLLRVFGTQMLVGLAFMVAIPIVIIPCLGFVAFLAWVVFLSVRYLFLAVPIQVLEEGSFFDAFRRASSLVKGAFWQTAGVFLLAYVAQSIVGSLFVLPFQSLMFVSEFHDIDPAALTGWLGGLVAALFVLSMVGSLLMAALMYLAAAFQYYSLAEQKEAASVEARVERLEQEAAAVSSSPSSPPASEGSLETGSSRQWSSSRKETGWPEEPDVRTSDPEDPGDDD